MPPTDRFPTPSDPAMVATERARLLAVARQRIDDGPWDATWESLATRSTPEWFRRNRFGIFVHWLVAGVPAVGTEWYPRHMYLEAAPEYTHHIATYGPQRDHGFKDFIPQFTASSFDASELLATIAGSGATYVVPVAEHHDGFVLTDSDLTRWTATRVGPHRDVLGELAGAAQGAGVIFGLSSHRAENWWFFNGGRRFESDVTDPNFADLYGPAQPKDTQPDDDFLDDWLARTVDLVERHRPRVIYFDWWIEEPAFEPYLRDFAAYYYNTVPDGVINYKWESFAPGSAVRDIERGSMRSIQLDRFQTDTSASRIGWAYLTDNEFKSASDVIAELVDVVSKNGNLLLNIGPRPDGTLCPQESQLLLDIGTWMSLNSNAIHDTEPWIVFGEGPTHPPVGSFVDTTAVAWTSSDLRFTTRNNELFATFLRCPADGRIEIRSLGTALRLVDAKVSTVELLGTGPLPWERTPDALVVSGIPTDDTMPGVLRISLDPPASPARYEPEMLQ